VRIHSLTVCPRGSSPDVSLRIHELKKAYHYLPYSVARTENELDGDERIKSREESKIQVLHWKAAAG